MAVFVVGTASMSQLNTSMNTDEMCVCSWNPTRYTMDNRRLYCLQKAAVALHPKEVGAMPCSQLQPFNPESSSCVWLCLCLEVRVLVKVMRQEDGSCREVGNRWKSAEFGCLTINISRYIIINISSMYPVPGFLFVEFMWP